jgi:hypothetical protein
MNCRNSTLKQFIPGSVNYPFFHSCSPTHRGPRDPSLSECGTESSHNFGLASLPLLAALSTTFTGRPDMSCPALPSLGCFHIARSAPASRPAQLIIMPMERQAGNHPWPRGRLAKIRTNPRRGRAW